MIQGIKKKKVLLLLTLLIALLAFVVHLHKRNIYVWAWERPENLQFLVNSRDNITVVYYAGGIVLKNGKLEITPRLNKLSVPPNIKTMPVVRIDNFDAPRALNDAALERIESFIVDVCSGSTIVGCQVDFDAKSSERDTYKQLLTAVRSKIPKEVPLSITALVSWCDTFSWLNNVPIDFAVPMFYRLGPDRNVIQNDYVGQTFMKSQKCQSAIGISTDAFVPEQKYLKTRDVYLFNPDSWTEESFLKAERGI